MDSVHHDFDQLLADLKNPDSDGSRLFADVCDKISSIRSVVQQRRALRPQDSPNPASESEHSSLGESPANVHGRAFAFAGEEDDDDEDDDAYEESGEEDDEEYVEDSLSEEDEAPQYPVQEAKEKELAKRKTGVYKPESKAKKRLSEGSERSAKKRKNAMKGKDGGEERAAEENAQMEMRRLVSEDGSVVVESRTGWTHANKNDVVTFMKTVDTAGKVKLSGIGDRFLAANEQYRNIFKDISPVLTGSYKESILPLGLSGEVVLEPVGQVCSCSGCGLLSDGGWAKQCAFTIPVQTCYAALIRNHARKAIDLINETFCGAQGSMCCARSFEVAMIARKALEFRTTREGGYVWSGATMLRDLCLGMARHELAVRLVDNKVIPPIDPQQEEATLRMFDALDGFPACGKPEKKLRNLLETNFFDDYSKGLIDPLTWQELHSGHAHSDKILGEVGSRVHLVAARALFQGRCVKRGTVPPHYFDYIIQFQQGLKAPQHRKKKS